VLRKVTHKMTFGDSNTEVFCAKFNQDDNYLACGYGDGIARIYNLQTGKLAFSLFGYGNSEEMPVTNLQWRPSSSSMKT